MNSPISPRKVEFFRHDLGQEEIDAVTKTLGSLFLTQGPRVAAFERLFGEYLEVPHVVAVSSCTDGLMLALSALGIGPGDEVITTPMTYVATSNSVMYVGATPVFADVDSRTALIDPVSVEAAITPRTRAILVVHLYGQMVDMKPFRQIADRHRLALIEDSAHGVETRRDGISPGQLSDAAVFSFYATKTMTSGDGGAIAVRDPALADKLRRLRGHGVSKDAASRYGTNYQHWDMVMLGFKANMTDIEASMLIPQLGKVEARRARRQAAVERYESQLKDLPGVRLVQWSGRSSHHLFTVLVPERRRDELLGSLGQRGIGVAVNYRAVHLLTYYRERFGFKPGAFPHAEEVGNRTLSLPLFPAIAADEVDYVAQQLRELLGAPRMNAGAVAFECGLPAEPAPAGSDNIFYTVVVPVLNEQDNVQAVVQRVCSAMDKIGEIYELLFVDDGSTDRTPVILRELTESNPRVRAVRLTRNFGQEAAVQAGYWYARGQWIIQMDGDLQNPPEEVHRLLEHRDDGFEIVYGVRTGRKDPLFRKAASATMRWTMQRMLNIELPKDISTFRLMRSSTAKMLATFPERQKFLCALACWIGAKYTTVDVKHAQRAAGKTNYNLGKLVNHTFDLVVGFSSRPLRMIGSIGMMCALIGFGFAAWAVMSKILWGTLMGWSSIFSAVAVLGGMQLVALSIIGEYVARIFVQSQQRPIFMVAEKLGFQRQQGPETREPGV